ncbi:MAG TPA: serine protease, partial [Planctomycetia bacterium]|nr:serine protease [Planctomycetia bacterium]
SMGIATEIRTLDPADAARKRELRGKVVATSKDADLALVRFENLNATPLPFAKAPLELASDVLILGFPQTQILGTGLKTTRGIVSALPDTTRPVAPEYVLFDAVADHGNSGGPIVDRNACVVGVLTIGLAELSGGLTAESATAFIKQHVPGTGEPDKDAEAPADEADWAAITRKISPSVLQLTCYYDAGIPELSVAARGKQHADNVYEDQTCPWCNGLSRIACPARGCVSGRISVPYTVEERVGQLVVSHKKTRKEPCRNCSGNGHVDCIGCRNGFDHGLR